MLRTNKSGTTSVMTAAFIAIILVIAVVGVYAVFRFLNEWSAEKARIEQELYFKTLEDINIPEMPTYSQETGIFSFTVYNTGTVGIELANIVGRTGETLITESVSTYPIDPPGTTMIAGAYKTVQMSITDINSFDALAITSSRGNIWTVFTVRPGSATILQGTVTDDETGDGVRGASVDGEISSVEIITVSATTDENGRFMIIVPSNISSGEHTYTLRARAVGYEGYDDPDNRPISVGSFVKGDTPPSSTLVLRYNPFDIKVEPERSETTANSWDTSTTSSSSIESEQIHEYTQIGTRAITDRIWVSGRWETTTSTVEVRYTETVYQQIGTRTVYTQVLVRSGYWILWWWIDTSHVIYVPVQIPVYGYVSVERVRYETRTSSVYIPGYYETVTRYEPIYSVKYLGERYYAVTSSTTEFIPKTWTSESLDTTITITPRNGYAGAAILMIDNKDIPATYNSTLSLVSQTTTTLISTPGSVTAGERTFSLESFDGDMRSIENIEYKINLISDKPPVSSVTRTELGANGVLTLDTTPVKGEIFVNGTSWGKGKVSKTVSAGVYTIRFADVIVDGVRWAPQQQIVEVEVKSYRETTKVMTYERAVSTASIRIRTTADMTNYSYDMATNYGRLNEYIGEHLFEGSIYLDDEYLGTKDITKNVNAGTHVIRVLLPDTIIIEGYTRRLTNLSDVWINGIRLHQILQPADDGVLSGISDYSIDFERSEITLSVAANVNIDIIVNYSTESVIIRPQPPNIKIDWEYYRYPVEYGTWYETTPVHLTVEIDTSTHPEKEWDVKFYNVPYGVAIEEIGKIVSEDKVVANYRMTRIWGSGDGTYEVTVQAKHGILYTSESKIISFELTGRSSEGAYYVNSDGTQAFIRKPPLSFWDIIGLYGNYNIRIIGVRNA